MDTTAQGGLARPAALAAERSLDWLNLFVGNIQTGFGPFIAIYLTTCGWTETAIGLALSLPRYRAWQNARRCRAGCAGRSRSSAA